MEYDDVPQNGILHYASYDIHLFADNHNDYLMLYCLNLNNHPHEKLIYLLLE